MPPVNFVRFLHGEMIRSKKPKSRINSFFAPLIFCFLFFSFCFLLQGCGGVPETFYYTLAFDPGPPPNNEQAVFPFVLGVEKFYAETIYDDDRIIYRESPFEVKYYYYRRWVAPPRHLLTEKVSAYLADSGLFQEVVTYPSVTNVKYVLGGRLLAFEEWDEQTSWYGKIAFKVYLYEPATHRVVWSRQFEHSKPVEKKIPIAVVEALSQGLKQCLDDLTKSLAQELGQQNPEP